MKIYVSYGQILAVFDKVPGYSFSQPKRSMRKIKEFMTDREYDSDFNEAINDDFCKDFGIAKEILFDSIKQVTEEAIAALVDAKNFDEPVTDMRKIKDFLIEHEYDQDFIETVKMTTFAMVLEQQGILFLLC